MTTSDQTPDVTTSEETAEDASTAIPRMRERIDEIDETLADLWLERAQLSQHIGRLRIASGGTRLALAREREVLDRFHRTIGTDGPQLALLLLRAGRGRL